mmetsp:Transcript_2081/g.4595  ORF Transcript_2081/g.4595 Transcript_2081/m.4595 type:complete len:119 (-) Transcript_2081:120-476(-)
MTMITQKKIWTEIRVMMTMIVGEMVPVSVVKMPFNRPWVYRNLGTLSNIPKRMYEDSGLKNFSLIHFVSVQEMCGHCFLSCNLLWSVKTTAKVLTRLMKNQKNVTFLVMEDQTIWGFH